MASQTNTPSKVISPTNEDDSSNKTTIKQDIEQLTVATHHLSVASRIFENEPQKLDQLVMKQMTTTKALYNTLSTTSNRVDDLQTSRTSSKEGVTTLKNEIERAKFINPEVFATLMKAVDGDDGPEKVDQAEFRKRIGALTDKDDLVANQRNVLYYNAVGLFEVLTGVQPFLSDDIVGAIVSFQKHLDSLREDIEA
ncbi:hypothetical protein CC86DRAFT_401352 [Ophiobolus disseminans]|uniref:Uncharacterized protein n=1 Tax=Ophiobolus disseminans TaxID=1469910 RepID=A0A6A7AIT1_9PLEO|nr:hypothetical protein CC86DRAFT_401352 [Ophiobolus disseminans]